MMSGLFHTTLVAGIGRLKVENGAIVTDASLRFYGFCRLVSATKTRPASFSPGSLIAL